MNINCQDSAYVGRTHLTQDDTIHKLLQGEIDTLTLNLDSTNSNLDTTNSNLDTTNSNLNILQTNYNITSNYIDSNVKPLINTEIIPATIISPAITNTYIYNSNVLGEIRFWVKDTNLFPVEIPIGVPDYRVKIDVDGRLKLYYTYDIAINLTWGNGWIDPANMLVGAAADSVNQGSAITALQAEVIAVDTILTNKIQALITAIDAILVSNACLLTTPVEASDLQGLMTIVENAFSIPQGRNALTSAFNNLKEFARTRNISFLSGAANNISAFINNNAGTAFVVGVGGMALGIVYGQIQNAIMNNYINITMTDAIEKNSNLTSNDRRELYDYAINDIMSSNVIATCENNFYLNQA